MADEETREPDGVSEAEAASAGQSESQPPAGSRSAFTAPDYEGMNERLSVTRKQAGPEFDQEEEPATRSGPQEDEEDIGPTDPS